MLVVYSLKIAQTLRFHLKKQQSLRKEPLIKTRDHSNANRKNQDYMPEKFKQKAPHYEMLRLADCT